MLRSLRLRRVFGVSLLLCLALAPVLFAEDAKTLDDVIACHIATMGGMDAIKGMNTLHLVGSMNMGGMEAPMSMEYKRPDKLRMEFTMQGMTGVMVLDGETGWSIMPFMGKKDPEKMAADQLKQVKQQTDQIEGYLVDWEKKGSKVEYLGTVDVEGTEAYKLHVTTANESDLTLYLDTEYCLDFRHEQTTEMMGQKINVTVTLGDYKEVGGVMMPHSIEAVPEGAPAGQVITFTEVKVNTDIDDARFVMPEVPAAAEAPAEGGE